MKEMKRILALVLCFVMLVGMMPAVALNAEAAEGVIDAAIFCSDVHDSTSAVSSVFGKIAESGVTYSTATFCGDTFTDKAGSSADVTSVAQSALGNTSLQGYYAWGDHDNASDIADDSGLVYSGNYYIYVLSMADMDNDYSAEEAAAEMAAFTDTVAGLDHTKPLFIASHQPLHARRSDNVRAAEWTEVINAAGEKMDIVFFWGHNHTGDGTVDQAVYYVEKGSTLNVETTSAKSQSSTGTSSSSTGTDMTINFTYMNAGYIGKDNAGRSGIATTVQITADSLIFQDYNSSGAYSGTHAHNVTVTRAFAAQETTPTVNTVTDTEDTTQDSVTAVGLGLTGVTLTQSENADTSAFSDCVAYEVALEGYTEGETVTLTFDIGYMDSTDLVVYANGEQITPVSVADNTEEDFHSVLVTVETTSATGTYIIGKLGAAEDAVLTGISVTSMPKVTSYTLVVDENADGDIYLDITGLVITATYDDGNTFPVEWNRFDETADGYALNFDISVAGIRTVKVTYGGFETSFDVTVYEHNAVDVDVAEAVAGVLRDGYIAKDFNPTGYTEGTEIRVVMPAPEGANVVYHVADNGTLTEVENVTFQDGYAIFDTDHFSAYVAGRSALPWVTIQAPGEYTVYKYTRVTAITDGNAYAIVDDENDVAFMADGTVGTVTRDASQVTSTVELPQWTFTPTGSNYYITNNGNYIRYNNGLNVSAYTDQAEMTVVNTDGVFAINRGNYSLYSNGNGWAFGSGNSNYVHLYSAAGTETAYDDTGLFARMDGTTSYSVPVGTSTYDVEQMIQAGITVYTTSDTSTEGTATNDYTLSYDYSNTSGEGTYTVTVLYNNVEVGAVALTVAGTPDPETATGSGETTTTTKKTVYVLTGNPSGEVLIANSNSASSTTRYLLARNGSSIAATAVTIKSDDEIGTYIELDDATDELWTVGGSYTFQNGGYYLRYSNGLDLSTSSSTTWSYSNNRLRYRVSNNSSYYLRYNNGWTTTSQSNSASSIYFYVPTEIEVETTTTVSGTYSIAGEDVTKVVNPDATEEQTAELTVTLAFTPEGSDIAEPVDLPEDFYENLVCTVVSDENNIIDDQIEQGVVILTGEYGEALVKISYTTAFGEVTNYVTVTATEPYYTIDLHKAVLTEATGVTADNFAEGTYYTFNETTNTYHVATAYVEGTTYYTGNVVQGDEITAPIALKGIEAGDVYGVWAVIKKYDGVPDDDGEDGADLGDVEDDRIYWSVSNETIATIDPATGVLTFTGTNYGTFTVTASYLDEEGKILCSDTITISAEDSLYIVPGDGTDDFPEYPNEGAVRFDKTATAVGNFSETGIALVELSMTGVPFTTDNAMDVVVMLDMTGSMSDDGMEAAEEATKAFVEKIVKNEDGTYNNNRVAVYAFNSGSSSPYELVSLGTISSDAKLETANTAIDTASDKQASGGTPFDEAAAKCKEVLEEAKTTNLPEDVESAADYNRQQFCVFMSDGGPTSYEGSDGYTYYAGNNSSGDRALTSYIGGYTSASSSSWTYNLPTEYYTDAMKADGVTIYTVGLLLQNAPSNPAPYSSMTGSTYDSTTGTLTTIGSHYYFTSTILKNMASDSGKYIDIFDVDNADDATAKFTAIAQSILEAAKDVEVVDEIGNNYTVNFSIPGYGTDNAVSSDALDGTTEFYIQAVEYQLNDEKERTGDPTVLENFTFNADGSFKSHTVGGVACENCDHVTFTDGTITAIDGTYFSYTAQTATDENGETYTKEFLNWQAEKLSTTELALQYFAYLDNSSGVAEAEQIPAGTYYTNEEATLTYTNYNGNRVQREFPVPQMTWNGAQVSYVFYLVNAAGQPVNRAGRVVPFAEAVYVTDVYTYSVVWNDLEQSAGLEAKYLAEKLVPEVYALYDDDATYQIHVYEDENEVNLNNHFVIGGNVTDEYNTITNSWTNAKTTYVFNNKSDATKYNTVGAYIANDGNDSSNSTSYYCKSAAIEGAVYTSETDVGGNIRYTVTDLGSGYQAVDGETQVLADSLPSTTGATVINGYAYYVDENNQVYTIVEKTNGAEVHQGFDFHNTTVAFAVVWKPELAPDTVVVDYGLDVVIDVITNDNMAAGVVGVRTDAPDVEMNSGRYNAAKARSVDLYINANHDDQGLKELKIGTAAVESLTSVRFSLDKDNGMLFSDPAMFYYEADVNFYDEDGKMQTTSMYSSVTVIPATTIYYEDEFVDLKTNVKQEDGTYKETDGWDVDSITASATQAQDRPGESKISADLDADNNYGYDAAYSAMSTYSMNRAAMVTVKEGKYATATFTFYGTGFDVISMTSNKTGTLTVKIVDANGAAVKNMVVDTYYGYTRDAEGNWVATPTVDNALYQVPVIKAEGLTYGKYTVTITASYVGLFDHTSAEGSYDLYLDAIRIYDPANDGANNKVVEDAYKADGEGWPSYIELRNKLIDAKTFNQATNAVTGEVFIDGDATVGNAQIDDYTSYGPNNELYLAKGQSIAFQLGNLNLVAKIQLGIKSADGNAVTYTIKNITAEGTVSNAKTATISTATDMYYDITGWKDGIIVITNSGNSGIISLTNIKATYTANPNAAVVTSEDGTDDVAAETNEVYTYMTPAAATLTLRALNRPAVVEPEETEPETTEPEVTEPETTEPEVTEPETTEPEVTEPEVTEPETTEPETTEPETTEPEETPSVGQVVKEIVKGIVTIIGKLFSRWF